MEQGFKTFAVAVVRLYATCNAFAVLTVTAVLTVDPACHTHGARVPAAKSLFVKTWTAVNMIGFRPTARGYRLQMI